ncbi:trans-resveratrol di-O-methyltransferase-like [Tasmannia lanceolata]|uniref:trans-resveratrol di-O-methyltransferase-like n=1 Tax=Tasmannia lanceolata TaxID=3420 RepID=UPI004062E3DF
MEVKRREGVDELLQAQAHVWSHVCNFISSMSLKCAVQLGIPDIVHNHGHPITLSELAAKLPIASSKTKYVHRLMRLLVHSGFFAVETNGVEEGYVMTPSSKLLLKENTTGLTPFLLMMLDPFLVTPWHFLSAWFQKDEAMPPLQMAHGMNIWDYASRSPELSNPFNEAMASDTRIVMNILVKECGSIFQGLESLADVGGGIGMAAMIISEAFPYVKCTVLDLPHVVASSPKCINVDFVGGDMFQSIPPANAVFLKSILHDWSDEECVEILRRCKEAIPCAEEGGKVIIVDMVVNTKNSNHTIVGTQLFSDMLMMVDAVGKERDELEWHMMFKDAGFSHYKIMPVLGLRSVIEVYP